MRHIQTRALIPAILALSALAACSESGSDSMEAMADGETVQATADSAPSMDAAGDAEEITAGGSMIPQLGELPVSLPKMAYVFDYGFRLAGDDIADLQQRHADMCETAGPYSCQILSMNHSGVNREGAGEYATGQLQLAVAAPKAREFGKQLGASAIAAGSEQFSSAQSGEDLSKAMVDTEARLRARTVLRDRLLETLRTRRGTVSELVEAERSVAQVNEEIDQARSWLTEMRGRVSFSRMNITYESNAAAAGSFFAPVSAAMGSVGSILGALFAFLILAGTVGIPLGLLVWTFLRLRKSFFGSNAATTES